MKNRFQRGSWQKVAPWYNKITDHGQGHYYHQHVVIPGALRLLGFDPKFMIHDSSFKLLDLACGNGVLAKAIPKDIEYTGIDIAPSLIAEAKRTDRNSKHNYLVADIANSINLSNLPNNFNAATLILALQNIQNPQKVLDNASKNLLTGGALVIVLNHPAFRIPRQSSWGIDESKKIQYRRIDKYMSPMTIPIRMNPSDPNSQNTLSYHFSISDYSKMLNEAGFTIDLIEEWTSDKESEGRAARMENRSRSEIPLFLTILARKKAQP
jgi:ubiquinone/menaquinone biosynthesis C-methylase UbiE